LNRDSVARAVYDPVDPACQPDPVPFYKALLAALRYRWTAAC
jgi:hypothetical protein